MEKSIVVFCSSSYTIDPKYNVVAREFVRKASEKGFTIVSGGTVKGTMGEISDELHRCGGKHVGILPKFMKGLEYQDVDELVWVDTMSVRKEMMRQGTCAAVALPGGIGTLDELMETLTLRKLKQYDGDIFVLNADGFYDPLADLLDYYVKTDMLDAASRALIRFPRTVDELIGMLEK